MVEKFWRWFNPIFFILNFLLFFVSYIRGDTNSMILHGVASLILGQALQVQGRSV